MRIFIKRKILKSLESSWHGADDNSVDSLRKCFLFMVTDAKSCITCPPFPLENKKAPSASYLSPENDSWVPCVWTAPRYKNMMRNKNGPGHTYQLMSNCQLLACRLNSMERQQTMHNLGGKSSFSYSSTSLYLNLNFLAVVSDPYMKWFVPQDHSLPGQVH